MAKMEDKLPSEELCKGIQFRYLEDLKELVLVLDLSRPPELSKSGKSEVLASTHGNLRIPGMDVTIGLNCYRKR